MSAQEFIAKIVDDIAKRKSMRHQNFIGFGLRLTEALLIARKLRDDPYGWDLAGQIDYKWDLNTLIDKLSLLSSELELNEKDWSGL